MPSDIVPASQLRRGLYSVLNRVQFKGETLTIIRNGAVVGKLVPAGEEVTVSDPTASLAPAATPAKTPEKTPEKPGKGAKNPGKTR